MIRLNMNVVPEYIVLAVFFLWALVLTFLFVKFYLSIQKISNGNKKTTILDILNNVIDNQLKLEKQIDDLDKEVKELAFDSQFHIQKIGLVRFNPFNDTGGDQSFILALVDAQDSGVVVSGLHTRNGTRWYAKKVQRGAGVEHELSNDEIKAIKSATKQFKHK